MTTEPQPTPALAAAARRRRELREALVAFEDAIASPFRDIESWRSRVAERLEALQDGLRGARRGDGAPGWPLRRDVPGGARTSPPARAGSARSTRRSRLRSPRAGGDSTAPLVSEADVDAVRDDLERLMGRIIRHRQGGADLVWEAYAIDIGGAG